MFAALLILCSVVALVLGGVAATVLRSWAVARRLRRDPLAFVQGLAGAEILRGSAFFVDLQGGVRILPNLSGRTSAVHRAALRELLLFLCAREPLQDAITEAIGRQKWAAALDYLQTMAQHGLLDGEGSAD